MTFWDIVGYLIFTLVGIGFVIGGLTAFFRNRRILKPSKSDKVFVVVGLSVFVPVGLGLIIFIALQVL